MYDKSTMSRRNVLCGEKKKMNSYINIIVQPEWALCRKMFEFIKFKWKKNCIFFHFLKHCSQWARVSFHLHFIGLFSQCTRLAWPIIVHQIDFTSFSQYSKYKWIPEGKRETEKEMKLVLCNLFPFSDEINSHIRKMISVRYKNSISTVIIFFFPCSSNMCKFIFVIYVSLTTRRWEPHVIEEKRIVNWFTPLSIELFKNIFKIFWDRFHFIFHHKKMFVCVFVISLHRTNF